ncbi:uncharacterized protein LOC121321305 [Polyodon spathula]|uniref:uncharacterized protein LOC121321305 n=1 Tax=Polyodon spathula TaxID=7913 RepID=UPI001B7DF1A8|nr:uncharacterized protein LOC121321305 [Polyodon spathula]
MGEYDNEFDGCYLQGNDTLLDSVNGSCQKKTVNLNKSEAHMDADDECHDGVCEEDCEEDPDYVSIAEGCSSPVQFGIRTGEHRMIKHKASTITFSDYGFSNSGLSSMSTELFINEGSDAHSSSSEGEDDVFTDLPHYREFLIGRHRRAPSQNKQKEEPLKRNPEAPPGWSRDKCEPSSTSSNETEDDLNIKQEAVQSPWSQSMTQLMKKLDQLNVDIEEALSASTSPSGTPAVKRRETCAVTLETALNQALHKKKLVKNKDPECSRLDSLPYSSSILSGLGARPKEEVSSRS